FTASTYRLALNFFHVTPQEDQPLPNTLVEEVEDAIEARRHMTEDLPDSLVQEVSEAALTPWRSNFRLTMETRDENISGAVYALTSLAYRQLDGHVFGLDAQSTRGTANISIYLGLRPGLSPDEARHLLGQAFDAVSV
ncbi:MAG: hypothetical protein AAF191_11780, partial [Verrucomicrobiota bacterium]